MAEIPVAYVPTAPTEGAHDDLGLTPEQRQAQIDALNAQVNAPSAPSAPTNPDQRPPAPEPQQPEKQEPLHIAIGNVEDVRAIARDAADKRLNAEVEGGKGGFGKWVRRLWKGNIAREHYQQKYHREAEQQIVESGNLYVHEGGTQAASDQTMESVVTRLTNKHVDELVSHDAGESYARIDNENDPQATAVKQTIRDLINRYSNNQLDDNNFEEEKNRALSELARDNPELLGEGLMFADNLLEVAQNVKAMVRHDRGVEDILRDARIDVGRLKTGVRTEARFGKTDQLIDTIQKTKIGKWLNETTITTAVSAVAVATKFTVQKGVAKAAALTGVLGAGGAIIAGARESKHIREDRRQHGRERAMGQEFETDARRREELETAQYESLQAADLATELRNLFQNPDAEGLRNLQDLTGQGFMDAIGVLAQIKARERLSDQRDIDLIHFSSAENVADERLQLALTSIYAETALTKFLEDKGGVDWLQQEVNLSDQVQSFDEIVDIYDTAFTAQLEGDMSAKDAIFSKIHRNHVLKAALIGGTVGMVLGTATQEAMAHLPVFGDNLYGLGEGKAPSGARETLANGGFNKISELLHGGNSNLTGSVTEVGGAAKFADVEGFATKQDANGNWLIEQQSTGKTIPLEYDDKGLLTPGAKHNLTEMGFKIDESLNTPSLSGVTEEFKFGNNKFIFPEEYSLKEASPGNWEILDQDGKLVHDLHLNFDGSLTDETITELRAGGIGVSDLSDLVETKTSVSGVGGSELVQNHLADTKQVHRTLWYGNDTPSPDFDLNELRTYAAGANGGWFDESGNVKLDITPMTPDGSFWGDQSADAHALVSEGKLSLAISATKDTQANVFDFQFTTTPEGRVMATIPPDSPMHQMFQMNGSERVFNGAYFEVMEHTGVLDANGEQVKILGTYEGTNSGLFNDTIVTTQEMHTTTLDITPSPENIQTIIYEGGETPLVEAAPVIPLYARRGLESQKEFQVRREIITGMYYGGANLPALQEWIRQNPEILHSRRVENGQWVEQDGSPVERSITREKENLRSYLDTIKDNDPDYYAELERLASSSSMQEMSAKNRVSVNIPAWMEGGTIYSLLDQYIQQQDVDGQPLALDNFEINVLINRRTGSAPDDSVAEIERFITDYESRTGQRPTVNYSDVEFNPPDNNVGNARRVLTDLTLLRSLNRGSQEGSLYIESEDADLLRPDPKTVTNIIRTLDEKPYLDSVRGIQDRSPEIMKENDYLFLWRRMWDVSELLVRSPRFREPASPNWNYTWNRTITGGWNTAYSAEAYAMIGGYDKITKGEDMMIGEKISMARGDGALPNLDVVGRVYTRTDSSPRRFVNEIITGRGAYSDDFEDEEVNRLIRESSLDELLDQISSVARIDSENQSDFQYMLEGHYKSIQVMTPTTTDAKAVFSRLMFFLGFKHSDYEFTNDNTDVQIKSLDNVKQALERYRQREPDTTSA